MHQQNRLMQKLRPSDLVLEESEVSHFSFLD